LRSIKVARVDVSLPPGAISDNIEVTGAAPSPETGTSQGGQVIESKAVSAFAAYVGLGALSS
jgi:hypothetical protein